MKRSILFSLGLMLACGAYAQYQSTEVADKFRQANPGLTSDDVKDLVITDQYTSSHNGVTHVYFRQKVNGIEVFNASSSIHIDRNGNVIQNNNAFIDHASEKVADVRADISVTAAVEITGAHISKPLPRTLSKSYTVSSKGETEFRDAAVSPEPVKAKKYYLFDGNALIPVWNVEIFDEENNDWWNVRVDASTGTVIEKNNWVTKCAFDHPVQSGYHFEHDVLDHVTQATGLHKAAGTGTYNAFSFPVESPLYGSRGMVSNIADPLASQFGWHDTDGVAGAEYTSTRGNNAWAYEDRANKNQPTTPSPDGGQDLIFDYDFTPGGDPDSNLDAAVTNLFVMNNVIHDIFYRYGFNEASGNFQVNNFGKGGNARDAVRAEAQDGKGTSNANFSTPADGQAGRMQMYIWPTASLANNLNIQGNNITGSYNAYLSEFGSKVFKEKNAQIALADDGSANPTYACNPLVNNVFGKIVLIERGGGTCSYTTRALNAQNAGAVAVIFMNNADVQANATGTSSSVNIPSAMISYSQGNYIKSHLLNDSVIMVSFSAFNPAATLYDSDFDNGVIVHEYGHGISNRLTGGPSNSNCLGNGEQAGEGWSDFFCLALTSKPTDNANTGRGIGNWLNNEPASGLGIRTFKYSRNMSIAPVTYNDVKTQIPPHGVGSVWCAMLWDIFWDMVDKYGYDNNIYTGTGGNNKTIQLVIDGLKLQPCSPGFVDARNAIIKADSINNGGANRELLWRAFARRGLGLSASQGSSSSRADGKEAFDLPADIQPTGIEKLSTLTGIRLSPNPASSILELSLPAKLARLEISIYDLNGRLVLTQAAQVANAEARLDVSGLANGLYIIEVVSGGQVFKQKLTIAH